MQLIPALLCWPPMELLAASQTAAVCGAVAQLIDEELQGYSTGIVDAAKAALQQAGARTLEDVPYVKEAFLVSHTWVCCFTCA